MVNKDQVEGKATEVKGKVTGDDSEELKGKVQGKFGDIKEKAGELFDNASAKINEKLDKKDKEDK